MQKPASIYASILRPLNPGVSVNLQNVILMSVQRIYENRQIVIPVVSYWLKPKVVQIVLPRVAGITGLLRSGRAVYCPQ